MTSTESPYSAIGYSGLIDSQYIKYNLEYVSKSETKGSTSIIKLYEKYGSVLWDSGRHKYNVNFFIIEISNIIDNVYFNEFTQEMLDFVIVKLKGKGNSNATVNRKIAALRKLLRKAYISKDIFYLPEFVKQKEKSGRIRFLSAEEEKIIFEKLREKSELYFSFSVFLVDTGARLSEAIGLKWNDIHLGRATFWVTKSGRSRTVPLTNRVRNILARMNTALEGPFVNVDQQNYRFAWKAAKRSVGLEFDRDVVPHILRHTCASRLVRGGIDLRRVQVWLGHQNLSMTMRYAHLASYDLDTCVSVLEKIVEK